MNMYQPAKHEISSQKYINTGFTPRFDNDDDDAVGNVDAGITYNNFRYLITATTAATTRTTGAEATLLGMKYGVCNCKQTISCYAAQESSLAACHSTSHSSIENPRFMVEHTIKKSKKIDMRQSGEAGYTFFLLSALISSF